MVCKKLQLSENTGHLKQVAICVVLLATTTTARVDLSYTDILTEFNDTASAA